MTIGESHDPMKSAPVAQIGGEVWECAVAEALKFPQRYLQKCLELSRLRQQCGLLQSRLEFVVRNLISIADNCEAVLRSSPDAVATGFAPPTEEETGAVLPPPLPSTEGADSILAGLPSVRRSVFDVLNNLGIVQVDLLGKTYENVTYNGQKIADPFQVIEAKQSGVARSLPVLEVVSSLWVQLVKEQVRIVRQGKVCC